MKRRRTKQRDATRDDPAHFGRLINHDHDRQNVLLRFLSCGPAPHFPRLYFEALRDMAPGEELLWAFTPTLHFRSAPGDSTAAGGSQGESDGKTKTSKPTPKI